MINREENQKEEVMTILRAEGLTKRFKDANSEIEVLRGIDLTIERGDKIAIVGASGSGKSTLLHLLSGLDQPTEGRVTLMGHALTDANERERGLLRNRYLGFIYQFHHLLTEFTAIDNVALPLIIGGGEIKVARQEAKKLLERVGLSHRLHHKPSKLSGGERQRVAIARALVTAPALVLADEPTGNLDEENAHQIFDLMSEINDEIGTALVIVTHDLSLAEKMEQRWSLRDGKVVRELN